MRKGNQPFFSLVVATYGRKQPLAALLDSLTRQTFKSYEIIIVDQNPDDRVKEVLNSYPHLPIRYAHLAEPGSSRARNLGLRFASGEVVGFPDDDGVYPEDFLFRVAQVFCQHPVDIVSGTYGEGAGTPEFVSKHPRKRKTLHFRDRILPVGAHVLFIRREALESMSNPFPEEIGPGTFLPAGEEVYLVAKLLMMGRKGLYVPELQGEHPLKPPLPSKELANSFVLTRLALESKDPLLLVRTGGRLLKGIFLLLQAEKRSFGLAKIKGTLLAFRKGINV